MMFKEMWTCLRICSMRCCLLAENAYVLSTMPYMTHFLRRGVPKLDDTVSGKGHLEKMHRLDREGHERLKGVESKYTP